MELVLLSACVWVVVCGVGHRFSALCERWRCAELGVYFL